MSETMQAVEKEDLYPTDVEVWRLHYAETLRHWYQRFMANRDRVAALGGGADGEDESDGGLPLVAIVGAIAGFALVLGAVDMVRVVCNKIIKILSCLSPPRPHLVISAPTRALHCLHCRQLSTQQIPVTKAGEGGGGGGSKGR